MIDHISIGVKDITLSVELYEPILAVLGFVKLVEKTGTVGFGKIYPEFWLNHRPDLAVANQDNGCHVCIRAKGSDVVDAFYKKATEQGASVSGAPGYRPEYHEGYYATFIRDHDNNHIEVVTFEQ
jgi:catechol 2,3-dioxygenase-like lactoylglutathione lyase family enzyme